MSHEGVNDLGLYKKRLAKGKILETGVVRPTRRGLRYLVSGNVKIFVFCFSVVRQNWGELLSMVYLIFTKSVCLE
jgi:hypothetical protein